jgi:DNA-binding transcriptional LysR family regulator
MEHQQLLHFCAAFEEKSFSKAAQRCFISQQGLSLSIKQLEERLAVPLFVRGLNGIEPTEFGSALWQAAHSYLNYHDRIVSEMRELKERSGFHLTIALSEGFSDYFPVGFFRDFIMDYSDIDLDITSFHADAIRETMIKQNISLGFSDRPVNTELFDSICQKRYKMHLVTGKNHRLAGRPSIKLAELCGEKAIILNNYMHPQKVIMELCAMEGLKTIMLGANDYRLINELCGTGHIVAFWAGPMAPIASLTAVAIDEFFSLYWEIHFIVNQRVYLNDAAMRFIAYTRDRIFADEDCSGSLSEAVTQILN